MFTTMAEQLMPPPAEWGSLVPGSATVTWRRAGDVRVLLAAGYALLLQVSHPTVGAGVSEHSRFRTDPWGRLLRTLDYSCTMVYAGAERAGEMGQRIRDFHKQIRGIRPDGVPYHALEPEAYAWVHATLAAGIVAAHERFGLRLGEGDREQLWQEWRTLGRLLGIRDRDLPPTWPAFGAYFERTAQHTLARTAAVEEVLDALARPMPPGALARLPPAVAVHLQVHGPPRRPDDRGTAARRAARALRHPLGQRPGARAPSPRREGSAPPRR